ncbi:MAG: bifunctional UDP-N-acetylglucosamine diphosphorylase/glucosamine-1-phosphate N-acetyltransferase GlmU [Betaproteobacteria bacterium]|nr:bifunctional UDP-N-acetylglucosamine diphosphorylase/glucosamine-1-phosphate N-acetyltransferase GlmU [Betaproteobacteria bacterium]
MSVVILAAGQGKRMKSDLPKVLQPIAGKPMLAHVIGNAAHLNPATTCVVYGHGGDAVRAAFPETAHLEWALQEPQLGTGHAVLQALSHIPVDGVTLILYGDVPLITAPTLQDLVDAAQRGHLAWLTQRVANPAGLGRILRDDKGQITAIIEDKDASAEQKKIDEINTGFLACPTAHLARWLPKLGNRNAQGEYYLTDILAMAVAEGVEVETSSTPYEWEVAGVNDKAQLAALERIHQRNLATRLMENGVTLIDPARIDIRGTLECGRDVVIDVNCVFEGHVQIGAGTRIGPNCVLRDAAIGADTDIFAFTHVESTTIGNGARIGPYARFRPGSTLADGVHIGNFVEVKNSRIGVGSKANHLSYIGDTTVGTGANIGAGTIVCNYDGANKHRTVIGDRVHIGSDVQLVAPVTIGDGADIAAGTTVWKDVPPGGLTLNAKTQLHKPEWKRPVKKK